MPTTELFDLSGRVALLIRDVARAVKYPNRKFVHRNRPEC